MAITQATFPLLERNMKMLENYLKNLFLKEDFPLSNLEFVTLKIINHYQELAQHNLAKLSGKDKTILTGNIITLEQNQLVVRTKRKRINV